MRERCKRRVREAIRLVVVRGARAARAGEEGEVDGDGLVRREEDVRETGPRKWLVPGASRCSLDLSQTLTSSY